MNKAELQNEMTRLAKLINIPEKELLPISDKPIENVQTIVMNNGLFELVFMERGDVTEILTTRSPDELLYYIFRRDVKSISYPRSTESEYSNLDIRREWFKRTREMFHKFENQSWQKRLEEEIEEELMKAPYTDAV